MSEGTTIQCRACRADIPPGATFWLLQGRWLAAPRAYCEECVMLTAPVVDPAAPLLAPRGWGPAPMGSAKRSSSTDVQGERSETK